MSDATKADFKNAIGVYTPDFAKKIIWLIQNLM